MLKWTYAYGYYIPEHENVKRQLFEYLQGSESFHLILELIWFLLLLPFLMKTFVKML